MGLNWVLGNGKEVDLRNARPINNQKVFTNFPLRISLGTNHVSFIANKIGSEKILN